MGRRQVDSIHPISTNHTRPHTQRTRIQPQIPTHSNLPQHTGSTTTLSNWILHRDKPLAALSCAGLALILGSNISGVEWLPAALHETRLYNTLGCGMLIGSSYLAHRNEKNHDHSHGHEHGHGHGGHHHVAEGKEHDDRKAK